MSLVRLRFPSLILLSARHCADVCHGHTSPLEWIRGEHLFRWPEIAMESCSSLVPSPGKSDTKDGCLCLPQPAVSAGERVAESAFHRTIRKQIVAPRGG